MKKMLKAALALVLTASFLLAPTKEINAASDTVTISVKFEQTEARKMLSMINKFRTGKDAWYWNPDNKTKTNLKGKLSKLKYDYSLEKIAMQRAAETALSFSHTRPNNTSCFTYTADGVSSSGENIAAGNSTAAATFVQWEEANVMYSGQGHRRNMLSTGFTAIGIGHVVYNGMHYWAQAFSYNTVNTAKTSAVNSTKKVKIPFSFGRVSAVGIKNDFKNEIKKGSSTNVPVLQIAFVNSWPGANYVTIKPVWKVENSKILSISGGKIKGVKKGSTKIYTTYADGSFDIDIKVK